MTSEILGPLASNPAVTNVLRQSITYSNSSGGALDLESVSNIDQDLASSSGNDVVEFDAGAQAVFGTDSVDGASGTHLAAAIATTDCPSGTFGWDVDILGSQSTSFPMDNGTGPAGPGDTAMSIGYDCGSIADGDSVTVTYEYLFATDLSSVPSDFGEGGAEPTPSLPIPALSPWALITLILLVAGLGTLLPFVRR